MRSCVPVKYFLKLIYCIPETIKINITHICIPILYMFPCRPTKPLNINNIKIIHTTFKALS